MIVSSMVSLAVLVYNELTTVNINCCSVSDKIAADENIKHDSAI